MTNTEKAEAIWEKIRATRIELIKNWQPSEDAISLASFANLPDLIRNIQQQINAVINTEELLKLDYELAVAVGAMDYPAFVEWNSGQFQRATLLQEESSALTSEKFTKILGM